ncbi:metallophosphoesterase family protein [Anaerovorax odorimutans]|uniref:metallophosphoesterase family protein n=1 Tax=Anaerovorax odorimutans TaxID=109327 RepID=UPI0003F74115|nr:metallophosphoesterase family protein [Anaerovorax odorimutans]
MKTSSRLDKVFKQAFPVPFDDTSKFVFVSDVHRGDNSLSDEFGRNRHIYYHALNHYYQNGFTYIEVGDGDELLEHQKYEHIRNSHIFTFDMLKKFYNSGRMYMLFGNHNIQLKDPTYVKNNLYRVYDDFNEVYEDLFPNISVHEALILTHRKTKQEIFVVHGHQGDLFNDQLWGVSYFLIRYVWRFLHIAGVKYAASPAKNITKRHRIEKNFNKWNLKRNIIIVCGHTHRPKFPNQDDPAYFNTGCCMHPRGITCLELCEGQFSLVRWNMHSKEDGTLFIRRTIIKGPKPITEYQKRDTAKETN